MYVTMYSSNRWSLLKSISAAASYSGHLPSTRRTLTSLSYTQAMIEEGHGYLDKPTGNRSFFGYWLKAVEALFPYVLEDAVVEEIVDADITTTVDQSHIDLREQAAIALFGSSVLNVDTGGQRYVHITANDCITFSIPHTDTVSLFKSATQPCSDEVKYTVMWHAAQCKDYADEHLDPTGTNRWSISYQPEQSYASSATPPMTQHGYTAFFTIADEFPISKVKNPVTFYDEDECRRTMSGPPLITLLPGRSLGRQSTIEPLRE
ncbi:hypothetical protein LTS18_005734 [Coniosporium uncinatum]|uniref:Uncharacterized protein n=1 Tax=Coniosporium uncinatum TaxID=93489 RepID=A0ACC3DAX6_9PEZI|nr:hypothetical protein LTS18_005734 [Coniosporium uncinatum]